MRAALDELLARGELCHGTAFDTLIRAQSRADFCGMGMEPCAQLDAHDEDA